MDVRIGVIHIPREIEVELADGSDVEQVAAQIEGSLSEEHGVLWFDDRRGRRVAIPAAKVAYVEIDAGHEDRRVGFGAAVK